MTTSQTLTHYMNYILFLLLIIPSSFAIFILNLESTEGVKETSIEHCYPYQCKLPNMADPNLKVEIIYQEKFKLEPNNLLPVSSMTFLGKDILILNKNNGSVYRIANGGTLDSLLLDVNVANKRERGLLGITVSKNAGKEYIFLYYTESKNTDGSDICPKGYYVPHDFQLPYGHSFCKPGTEPLGNKLYRYELEGNRLINPKLLLDLPVAPGPSHNGGAIQIGPDQNVYVPIGDLQGWYDRKVSTRAQNFQNGTNPDGRAGILRVTQDGDTVGHGILGPDYPLNLYYAYGIRNSFGIDFDPLTGNLWDTENGPEYGDEINLVKPGFNSGWQVVQGIWTPFDNHTGDFIPGNELLKPNNLLVDFEGKGHYSTPEFIWKDTIGPTGIKFLNSDRLGNMYKNDLFVGCVSLGVIFHYDLNKDRTKLKLNGTIKDTIANNSEELKDIVFAAGLGRIADIEVGPDGYMYVLSGYQDKATIFRIVPVNS
jgi:aldose sugar dehydrogenase